MKVSEDRFPLLFLYFEEQEEHCDVRARTVSKGAAQIMRKWPNYLSFVSYMSIIGLFSLLGCLMLCMLVLSLTSREVQSSRKFPVVNCDREQGSSQAFRLSNFDHLIDSNNATFIVDVNLEGNEKNNSIVACAIESYLIWTSHPLYHVRLVSSSIASRSVTVFEEFEKKFKNYKLITAKIDSFLSGTSFANVKVGDESVLRFWSKVLISWNFGGIVLDSDLITVSNFKNFLNDQDNSLIMGLSGDENVFIATKRVCHSFIFSLMKYLTKTESESQAELTRAVLREFCSRGRNCSAVQIVSKPFFCDSEKEKCIFIRAKGNTTHVWNRVCPLAKFFS